MYTKPKNKPAAAPRRTFPPEAQQAIDNLVEMGYGKEDVEAAMIAAFMNPDRAVQYLEEGIPPELAAGPTPMEGADDAAAEPTPTTWNELLLNRQFQREIGAITDQASLQAYLGALAQNDPQKLALIQANPQPFAALLNASQASGGGGAPPAGGAPGGGAAPLPFGMAAPG